MKFEHNDPSLILSQTNIPDVFFTEYLSQADGDYVKIYLYLCFLSKYNKDVKINDLSKKLAIPFVKMHDAIKYWEDQGLLIRKNQGFIVANIQEIEFNKLYKPRITLPADYVAETKKNQNRASAIEIINDDFFQGVMSTSWATDIEFWFKKYGFDEEVMIALFRHCFNKSALHRSYIVTVADAWHKNNIKTFNDLEEYYEKEDKVISISNSIKKKLRISRNLSEYEIAYVRKWVINYNYGLNIIEIALKKTTSKFNPSFEYLDKLLSDWNEHNFKTPEQINKHLEVQKSIPKQSKPNNNSNSFTQRNYSNINNLYDNA